MHRSSIGSYTAIRDSQQAILFTYLLILGLTMHQQAIGSRLHQMTPDLGSRLGIEGLTADERGCLTFALGETVILVEEVCEGIVLTGFVDSLPDEPSERLLVACLMSNLNAVKSGLPVISVEETTRSLVLQLWSHAGTAEELMAAMDRFARQIERVRDSVCRFGEKDWCDQTLGCELI